MSSRPGPPLVSVIVPVYNGERYLAEALESILAQRGVALDVVVVDDGSGDESAAVAARSAGVRLVRQENRGLSAARNRGVALARGHFLTFLDADDVLTADSLPCRLERFRAAPHLEAVLGQLEEFISPELAGTDEQVRARSIQSAVLAGTMLVRRAAFERVGAFDPRWRVGEFVDWYARSAERGLRVERIPDVVLRRRVHTMNMTRRALPRDDYARIVKAALDRRRAARTLDAPGE